MKKIILLLMMFCLFMQIAVAEAPYCSNQNIYQEEGKNVAVNVLNALKSTKILMCENDFCTSSGVIRVNEDMGGCELFVHDNSRYAKTNVSYSTAPETIDIELTEPLESLPEIDFVLPEETIINIQKGWNIIPGHGFLYKRSTCFDSAFFFAYEPISKKFIRGMSLDTYYEGIYYEGKNVENIEGIVLNIMATANIRSSAWYYSPIDCQMSFGIESVEKLLEREGWDEYKYNVLSDGWNFLYTAKPMHGKTLNEIKGTCEILSAYYYENQAWKKIDNNEALEELGKGFIVKAADRCELELNNETNADEPLTPPEVPI
ncbi:MAG: hypothetical protein ABIA76_04455 [Candidatus Diapherotrites archaeon]